jgi:acyl-CoA thioesterase-1
VKNQEAFPALVQEKIRERGLPFEVVNAGVGGDTTAGGLRRLEWLLQRQIDILILELGGNDGLRGLPVRNIKENLQAMIDKAKAKNPEVKIVVAGMQMPPNVGMKYREEFQQVFYDVAKENNATMIPFLLEGVGGLREFNQPDLIHPNPTGHRIVADVVWKTIEPLLTEVEPAMTLDCCHCPDHRRVCWAGEPSLRGSLRATRARVLVRGGV